MQQEFCGFKELKNVYQKTNKLLLLLIVITFSLSNNKRMGLINKVPSPSNNEVEKKKTHE